ncbi:MULTISPECIES: diguanylate cyclase domain-containing protein [Leptospira]|uniref:diguanylate cyclase n=5 Tax=Leptospira borgpetersenii TaxID=174 RepID=M3GJ54_LEPBO|nr:MULTISPECIES: diguanylate cyclase [Leptospira]EMG00997.1 diguanylate cyclase (GGDEF) domain protein [Leptospira borgpetersenii str. 200701203]EMO09902.1 diguanylate cyclase (GGDEF) domain protein [Leptospira borgpetersenii str. Noumea 25]ALO25181.1 diguanylate cyclase (GGDEF) domain protein [Leptospira borgpetersenii serovar Ballum]ANH00146.1 Diguanylate cyclase (GGDEF) domain protein [Leptospira borgpetersenii str. 4E]AXX15604.1 diguanylate cyclase response regulator [Leptospira borgpeters
MNSILILDDAQENCMLMQGILRKSGYKNTYTSQSPEEVIDWLNLKNQDPPQKECSLILLDILLPGVTGFEILELIREKKELKDIPVIMITALKESNVLQKAFDSGAIDYVIKPFDATELLARVRSALRLFEEMTRRKEREKELEKLTDQLQEVNSYLVAISRTDSLTGLYNRRYFDEILTTEWKRCWRTGAGIALIMLDIDHFKLYNDTYGHQGGDQCLKQVARAIRDCARRAGDVAARYGGEEFAVILPETNESNAVVVSRNILENVEKMAIPHSASKTNSIVTVSIGMATLSPSPENSITELIERADKALYLAKEEGRNCLRFYPQSD